MVSVEGDLQRLDVTILGEVFFKFGGRDIGGDFAHEDVVVNELLGVGSEEFVVVGESTARLAIELEVAEGFTGLLELGVVSYGDDGSEEGFVDVTTNLRLSIELDIGLFLEVFGELDGGVLLLGEVVDVEIVLLFHCFCFLGLCER